MKFILLVLPVLLLVCTVYGEEQFMVPPFLLGATEAEVKEMKELLERYADKPDFQVEAAVEEWVKAKGGMIKVRPERFIKMFGYQKVSQVMNGIGKEFEISLIPSFHYHYFYPYIILGWKSAIRFFQNFINSKVNFEILIKYVHANI